MVGEEEIKGNCHVLHIQLLYTHMHAEILKTNHAVTLHVA